MNPEIKKLPLDTTGTQKGNRVYQEYHDITKQSTGEVRVIVMNNGFFYKDSITVTDKQGMTVLKNNQDYQITGFSPEILKLTGKEACSIIVINNTKVGKEIFVSGQMVGGPFNRVGETIASKLKGLFSRTRRIKYANIKEVPDAFTLNGHIHPYWDLYSFTPRISLITRMKTYIKLNLEAELEKMKQDFNDEFGQQLEGKNEIFRIFKDHIDNKNNPHQVTLTQVNLNNVTNGGIGELTDMSAVNEYYPDLYLTPLLLKEFVTKNFDIMLDGHIERRDNPHKVTANQVGSYSQTDYNVKNGLYYDRGETTTSSVRFGGTKDAANETVLGGKTFDALYNELRVNLNANEIKSGTLSHVNIGGSQPSSQSFLVYENNALRWKRGSDLTSIFGVVENFVYGTRWPNADSTDHVRSQAMSTSGAISILNSERTPYYEKDGTLGMVYYYGREYKYVPWEWGANPAQWRWWLRSAVWARWNPGVKLEPTWTNPGAHDETVANRGLLPKADTVVAGRRYHILNDSANRGQWSIVGAASITNGDVDWVFISKAEPIWGPYGPAQGPEKPTHNIAIYVRAGMMLASVSGVSWLA